MTRIIGDKKLKRKFIQLEKKIKNKRGLYKSIGIKILNEIDNNFKTESHEGTPWPLPTVETVLARRGEGDIMLLQDTGLLRASFSPSHSDSTYETNNKLAKIGTITEYAKYHEQGKGRLPKRRMIPSNKRGLEISLPVAEFWTDKQLKDSKLK